MKRMMLVVIALSSGAFEARAADLDGDGIIDFRDNCLTRANVRQLDPDLDGYGNRCDGDVDQDGDIDQQDLEYCSSFVGGTPPECDFDEDGFAMSFSDFAAFGRMVGGPPGPSGLACAGTVPCVAEAPALDGVMRGALLLTLIAGAAAIHRRYGGRLHANAR